LTLVVLFVHATFHSGDIIAVSSAEVAENVVRNLMFYARQILGKGSPKFLRAFVNWHNLRPILANFGWDPMAGPPSMMTK